MTPYYEHAGITIYNADCRDVLPTLEAGSVDLVLTDPPYGIAWKTPVSPYRPKSGAQIVGDDAPFDPTMLLAFTRLIVFGANHFANRLPNSAGWIVWDKRDGMPSNDQSDCELAWTNFLGSVRIFRCRWNGGGSLLAENGRQRMIHPSQKPVRLMRSILEAFSDGRETILDPFMGTGTTLRAAKDLGRRAIGIEIEERYCEIAARRLSQEVMPL